MCLAVPGKLLDIQGDDPIVRTGRVSFSGVVKQVSLACAPEARVGDYVLVHVGLAISVIDPHEAERTLRYLREMGDLDGLEAAPPDSPPP
jgi:hydrogenase expression/formation protein HypC